MNGNGTLLRKVNGSSSFCKGPRTSKVWKSFQKVWSSIFFFPVSLLLRFWILSRNDNLLELWCLVALEPFTLACLNETPCTFWQKFHFKYYFYSRIDNWGSYKMKPNLNRLIWPFSNFPSVSYNTYAIKVWTFWEAHKIWKKNLPLKFENLLRSVVKF